MGHRVKANTTSGERIGEVIEIKHQMSVETKQITTTVSVLAENLYRVTPDDLTWHPEPVTVKVPGEWAGDFWEWVTEATERDSYRPMGNAVLNANHID